MVNISIVPDIVMSCIIFNLIINVPFFYVTKYLEGSFFFIE